MVQVTRKKLEFAGPDSKVTLNNMRGPGKLTSKVKMFNRKKEADRGIDCSRSAKRSIYWE